MLNSFSKQRGGHIYISEQITKKALDIIEVEQLDNVDVLEGESQESVQPHANQSEYVHVLRGSMRVLRDKKSPVKLKEDDGLMIEEGELHALHFGVGGCTYLSAYRKAEREAWEAAVRQ